MTDEQIQREQREILDEVRALGDGIRSLEKRLDNLEAMYGTNETDEEEYETDNSVKSCIKNTMNNFDFAKVHRIMEFLDWKWHIQGNVDDGVYEIPSVEKLKEEALTLLNTAFRDAKEKEFDSYGFRESIAATGGLKAWACESRNEGNFCELEFVAEEWREEPV